MLDDMKMLVFEKLIIFYIFSSTIGYCTFCVKEKHQKILLTVKPSTDLLCRASEPSKSFMHAHCSMLIYSFVIIEQAKNSCGRVRDYANHELTNKVNGDIFAYINIYDTRSSGMVGIS